MRWGAGNLPSGIFLPPRSRIDYCSNQLLRVNEQEGVDEICGIYEDVLIMSRAFMKEGDDQWLSDIAPTMSALLVYLTRENNGIRVYEEKRMIDANGREVFQMTNGLTYSKDAEGKWIVVGEE